jgi:ATP-binding cassette subfamily B protein
MLFCATVDVLLPLLLGYAIRHNIQPRTTEGIEKVLAAAVFLMTIQAVSVRAFVAHGLRAETGISRSIRNSVFFHLQKLSLDYYNKTPVGYMMARTNSDTSRIGDLVAWGLIDFSWSFFYCVGVVIAMFLVHWQLAIIVCTTIPPLAIITWIFQKRILSVNRIMRKINSKMTGAMNEGITGARTVKVLVAEKESLGEYSGITSEYRFHATHMARLRSIFIPMVFFIGSMATAAILGYGGWEIAVLGAELSVLAIFLQYAGGFFDPINNIANVLTEFVSTQANIERVSGLLEQNPGITDRPEIIEKYGDVINAKKENWETLEGDVEFRDVTFKYPEGTENILEHFNLHVDRKSVV